jgi:hypothetical protein
VVNGLYPERFTREDAERLRAAVDGARPAGGGTGGRAADAASEAVRAALAEHERVRGQRSQLRRLRRRLRAPVATLPFCFEPELGVEQLGELARRLERAL